MRVSLERILQRPVDLPVEITLSSGDPHLLPHPDHAQLHPNARDLVICMEEGPLSLAVNSDQIVSIRWLREASEGRLARSRGKSVCRLRADRRAEGA